MASKENQEALKTAFSIIYTCEELKAYNTLEKAIDDLELYKKALHYVAYCICYDKKIPTIHRYGDNGNITGMATQLEIKNYLLERCVEKNWHESGTYIIIEPKNYELSEDELSKLRKELSNGNNL